MANMAKKLEEGEHSAMKQAILDFKQSISIIMPGMEEVDAVAVLKAIKDPNCKA